jgi:DNA-binding MarR family transcriptional regulator
VSTQLRHKNPADPVELGRRAGHLIWRAQQRGWRLFAEVAGNVDITPVQASVLLVIYNQPGVDQKTLAEMIALDRATTGNVVARLEARGLLKRNTPAHDRRAKTLYLTRAGAILNRKLGRVTRRSRKLLLKDLTMREQKELIRLLRKILDIQTKRRMAGGNRDGHYNLPRPARASRSALTVRRGIPERCRTSSRSSRRC